MNPRANLEKSIFDKAKRLLGAEMKKREVEKSPDFIRFKAVIRSKLTEQAKKFQELVKKLNISDKYSSKEIFLNLFTISLLTVVADNKVTSKELALFEENSQRQFNVLRLTLIAEQLKQDKENFERLNIENTEIIKHAKFSKATKRLKDYRDKKLKFYDGLLQSTDGNQKLKYLIEPQDTR